MVILTPNQSNFTGMIQKNNKARRISAASNIMLFSGVGVLIASLIYMIVNSENADLIVGSWIPFIVGGVFIVFFSQLFKQVAMRSE